MINLDHNLSLLLREYYVKIQSQVVCMCMCVGFFVVCFCFLGVFFFLVFLGLNPWHMEVPRLGV